MDIPTPPVSPVPPAPGEEPASSGTHILGLVILFALLIGAVGAWIYIQPETGRDSTAREESALENETAEVSPNTNVPSFAGQPAKVPFESETIAISPLISKSFSISEIQNIDDIEKAYGFTFSKAERDSLEKNKFVVKNILDTNLTPVNVNDYSREFLSLYEKVQGSSDYRYRTDANAVFVSSDVLMNLFSILSVELLKETENSYLFPQVLGVSEYLYAEAGKEIGKAENPLNKKAWTKIRNYFALPYALLSTTGKPISPESYWESDRRISIEEGVANYQKTDGTADSIEKTTAFIKSLKLDPESESVVLADLKKVYEAGSNSLPDLFVEEYRKIPGGIDFKVPFSTFKPRGSYTGSSLRRQYFRAVQWYQQIPFFTSSPELTDYALKIARTVQGNPTLLSNYTSLSSLLSALIGKSDDFDVSTYADALASLGENATPERVVEYAREKYGGPKIKSLPATYPTVGGVTVEEVLKATESMRFFSEKFIPDSYWTGKLTQGDEKGAVGGLKLPSMASSLEVMDILGSDHAHTQLSKIPFYQTHKEAIDARVAELKTEAAGWGDDYWKSNQVTGVLWSISGLFDWLKENETAAPQFMQSPLWDTKTLLTGSAFWTELRHTNILYAKQSGAEKGGGGDDCDTRPIPPPVYGYVEPQPQAYDRLYYTARLLHEEYDARGLKLENLSRLQTYADLVNIVREYTKLELENTQFEEKTITKEFPEIENCAINFIDPSMSIQRGSEEDRYGWNANSERVSALSRAEELRQEIVNALQRSLPVPVEGPILPIKDKRTALIADVHRGFDIFLEEAIGVPRVIFVAVKDANGARLTTGFTYSHYEFESPTRLTDEEWQDKFYTNAGGDYQITYKPKATWPTLPAWYHDLLGVQ